MKNGICVIGLGHAGIPLSCVIAETGNNVYGYDIDSKKVEMLNKGVNLIKEEPGVKEILDNHLGFLNLMVEQET